METKKKKVTQTLNIKPSDDAVLTIKVPAPSDGKVFRVTVVILSAITIYTTCILPAGIAMAAMAIAAILGALG